MRSAPLTFFVLLCAITIPFYWLDAVVDAPLPAVGLPVSVLMTWCPAFAAAILVYRESGGAGVKRLLRRAFDVRRIPDRRWLLPAFFLMPLVTLLQFWLMTALGIALPPADWGVIAFAAALFPLLFLLGVGEELGWMGYAFAPLRARWQALGAALILGVAWALWHLIPYSMEHPPLWVVGQCAATVALRVIIVWIYANSGESLLAAIVCHATVNIGNIAFPDYNLELAPLFAFIIQLVIAVLVVVLWGSRTLARFRFG